jgi:hypothetical membrane protein
MPGHGLGVKRRPRPRTPNVPFGTMRTVDAALRSCAACFESDRIDAQESYLRRMHVATTLSMTREHVGERTGLAVPGAILLVLSAQFMTVIMLAASMAPGYDVAGGAISDLGVIRETALLFNTSLVVVGALNLIAGFLFYRSHGRLWILVAFVLAGLGAAGAGLVPLDTSDLHGIFALVAFLFFNVEAIACATVVDGPMKATSVLAGIVGLGFVVVMVIGDSGATAIFGPIGHGGAERMIVYPPMFWMMAFGGYLMAHRRA